MDYRALVQKLGDRTNQNSQTSELILEHRTGHPINLIKLLVKVIKFLDRLIVSMDKEVTIENQKHLDKIRSMSSSLRDMIECNVKDKVLKEELVTSINDNEFKIIDLLNNH